MPLLFLSFNCFYTFIIKSSSIKVWLIFALFLTPYRFSKFSESKKNLKLKIQIWNYFQSASNLTLTWPSWHPHMMIFPSWGQSLSKTQGQIKHSQRISRTNQNMSWYIFAPGDFSLFKWIHLLDMHLEITSHIR